MREGEQKRHPGTTNQWNAQIVCIQAVTKSHPPSKDKTSFLTNRISKIKFNQLGLLEFQRQEAPTSVVLRAEAIDSGGLTAGDSKNAALFSDTPFYQVSSDATLMTAAVGIKTHS